MTMTLNKIVVTDSLVQARILLSELAKNNGENEFNYSNIIITNSVGSVYYLGIKFIHCMFQQLKKDYNIKQFIIQAEDDHAAVLSALELGYKNIEYSGESLYIQNLIKNII